MFILVQWASRKQKVVVLTSTKVENKFLSQVSTKITWIKS